MKIYGNCENKFFRKLDKDLQDKVRVATMTHDHDDTPRAILTLLVVPAGK